MKTTSKKAKTPAKNNGVQSDVSTSCQHSWDITDTRNKLNIEYYCGKCGAKRPVGNLC